MLTICIPTFNRSNFFDNLLKSIYIADKKVKIIIVNNCSTDNTKFVISKFKKKFKHLSHFTHNKKKSYDENYIFCLNKIKTKYGWVIGDDDEISSDSIKVINIFLKRKNITGITCDYNLINQNKKIIKNNLEFKNFDMNINFYKFGMLSTQIININLFKELQKKINLEKIKFNGYAHMYIIAYLLRYYKNWFYFKRKIINYRSGNLEYFKRPNDYFSRLKNELLGYSVALKILFNRQHVFYIKNMDNIYKKNIESWLFLSMIKSEKLKTIKLMRKYFNIFPLKSKIKVIILILITLIIPKFILINIKKVRRKIINYSLE